MADRQLCRTTKYCMSDMGLRECVCVSVCSVRVPTVRQTDATRRPVRQLDRCVTDNSAAVLPRWCQPRDTRPDSVQYNRRHPTDCRRTCVSTHRILPLLVLFCVEAPCYLSVLSVPVASRLRCNPSNFIWSHLSYDLVRSKRKYCQNYSIGSFISLSIVAKLFEQLTRLVHNQIFLHVTRFTHCA